MLSPHSENDASNINISGRQRMLSQKMTKIAYSLLLNDNQYTDKSENINSLHSTADIFDRTLVGFLMGGEIIGADRSVIHVAKLKDLKARKIMDDSILVWRPMHEAIMSLHEQSTSTEIRSVVLILDMNNLRLLDLMNDLTVAIEANATFRSYIFKGVQIVVVMLILILYLLAALRLYRREKYYSHLTGKSSDIIMGVSPYTGKIKFVSASAYELLGYRDEELMAKPAIRIFHEEAKSQFEKILESLSKEGYLNERCIEIQLVRKDETTLSAEMLMNVSLSEDGKSIELYLDIRDITARKILEKKIEHMAHHDQLTGLPNRYLFNDRLSVAMTMSRRHKLALSLLFIDLNKFKPINDNYGHQAGDLILKQVSNRLNKNVRESDTVSRYGGDEFVILLQEIDEKDTILIAEKIFDAITVPFEAEGEIISISCSMGIAIYSGDHETLNALVERADRSMYSAKESGKRWVQLNPEL